MGVIYTYKRAFNYLFNMALRATNHQNRIGSENHGPVKVETKVVQGPVLRRAALGDVGNRSIPNQVSKVGEALKKTVASKSPIASKPTTSAVQKMSLAKKTRLLQSHRSKWNTWKWRKLKLRNCHKPSLHNASMFKTLMQMMGTTLSLFQNMLMTFTNTFGS